MIWVSLFAASALANDLDTDMDPCSVPPAGLWSMPAQGAEQVPPNTELALASLGVFDTCDMSVDVTVNGDTYSVKLQSGRMVVPVQLQPTTDYTVHVAFPDRLPDHVLTFSTGANDATALPPTPELTLSELTLAGLADDSYDLGIELTVSTPTDELWWVEVERASGFNTLAMPGATNVPITMDWFVEELPVTECFEARLVSQSGVVGDPVQRCATLEDTGSCAGCSAAGTSAGLWVGAFALLGLAWRRRARPSAPVG